MKFAHLYLTGLVFACLLYSINSYLILLRDPFLLERIGVTLGNKNFEIHALKLADQLHVNILSIIFLTLSLCLGFLCYFKLYNLLVKKPHLLSPFSFVLSSFILMFLIFISFPSLSTDVFDYNNVNRVFYIHNHNPWLQPADHFPQDQEIYYGSWIDRPSVYPPLNFVVSSIVYLFFGANPLISLIGFKSTNVVFALISAILIWKNNSQSYRVAFTLLFLWNPLILIEFIGNAHNDLFMGLLAFMSLIDFKSQNYFRSAVVLGLAILTKFSVAIYIPLLLITIIKNKGLIHGFSYLLIICLTLALGLIPLGFSASVLLLNFSNQLSIYSRSLPSIIRYLFILLFGNTQILLANFYQKIITFPLVIFLLFHVSRNINLPTIFTKLTLFTLFYFALVAPMLQPWYLAWIFPIVVLSHHPKITLSYLVFSFSSLFSYVIYFLSLFIYPTWFFWFVIQYCVIIIPAISIWSLPAKWYTHLANKIGYEKIPSPTQ